MGVYSNWHLNSISLQTYRNPTHEHKDQRTYPPSGKSKRDDAIENLRQSHI